MTALNVIEARPEHAAAIMEVIHRSFGVRQKLDPPSTALDETVQSVEDTIRTAGGLVVERRGVVMGAMLFDDSVPGQLGFRRVSVHPEAQDRGVASAMVGVAEDIAEERGMDGIWLHVREELPDTVRFWTYRKYLPVRQDGTLITMGKTLWLAREIHTPQMMRDFAVKVASLVRAGDLLILSGDLGSGKTTFTQGLGEAIGVRGPITSPTFVIARTHPNVGDGPPLVHVDAYRLGGTAEIDDIDLDATADQAVTVVEWGDEMAEQLSSSWLHVRFEVRTAAQVDPAGTAGQTTAVTDNVADFETRLVTVRAHGVRWLDEPLRSRLLA